jgi:protein SCO1/2
MKTGRVTRRLLLWGLLGLLVTVGGGFAAWPSLGGRLARTFGFGTDINRSQGALETLAVYGRVPDFSLIERSGRSVTLADLLGKVWVANFIYTQCTETCPTQSLEVSRLQAEFATEPDLRLVSITVDPERDTPEVLAEYAERYQADPERWLFLTGPKRAIYRLAADGFKLSVVDPDDPKQTSHLLRFLGPRLAFATHGSKGLVLHSSRFVLVDRQARLRAYHHPTEPESLERLRQNLKVVLREQSKEG